MADKNYVLKTKKDFNEEQWKWISSRPEEVRKVIMEYPPASCYRGPEGKGHYIIYSYSEVFPAGVLLKIIHGKDSFMPGAMVFGITPSDLVRCDCGKWEAGVMEKVKE